MPVMGRQHPDPCGPGLPALDKERNDLSLLRTVPRGGQCRPGCSFPGEVAVPGHPGLREAGGLMGWEEEYRKALESGNEDRIDSARRNLMRRDRKVARGATAALILVIAVLAFIGYVFYKTHH